MTTRSNDPDLVRDVTKYPAAYGVASNVVACNVFCLKTGLSIPTGKKIYLLTVLLSLLTGKPVIMLPHSSESACKCCVKKMP